MNVRIEIGERALGAKDDFVATASEQYDFSNISQLEKTTKKTNYVNPCELYSTLLDGGGKLLDLENESDVGWWSKQISQIDGTMDIPITLTFKASRPYESKGIMFEFDALNNIHPTEMVVDWYGENMLLARETYYPDNALYYCERNVSDYDKVVVTFNSINMPYNRLRVQNIEYGFSVFFDSKEIKNAKIIQEINPISADIPISIFDCEIDTKQNVDWILQKNQPLSIYHNESLKMFGFIKNFEKISETFFRINAEDLISRLDMFDFPGDMYNIETAYSILWSIFSRAGLQCNIDPSYAQVYVDGYIPYCTCREALTQVCFAVGAIVNSANSDVISVKPPPNTISQELQSNRIMRGIKSRLENGVADIKLTVHRFFAEKDVLVLYDSGESEAQENVLIIFPRPVYNLKIANGVIREFSANHAIIDAFSGCILAGQEYKNSNILLSYNNLNPNLNYIPDAQEISINDATLASKLNSDDILNRCYEFYANTNTIEAQIIDNRHRVPGEANKYGEHKYGSCTYSIANYATVYDQPANVGDCVRVDAGGLGGFVGLIVKQTFDLRGGILIKNSKIRGVWD